MDVEMVECACGCGGIRTRYDTLGKERRYISGHNDHWKGHRRPPRVCPNCGKEFVARGAVVKDGSAYTQMYCSRECWYQRNTDHIKYEETTCTECGVPIRRSSANMKAHSNHFCCSVCRSRYSQRMTIPVPPQHMVIAVRERDGDRCKICGWTDNLQVHHIDQRSKGGKNEMSNLITLCPNHHKMADSGQLKAETLRALLI